MLMAHETDGLGYIGVQAHAGSMLGCRMAGRGVSSFAEPEMKDAYI